MSEQSGAAPTPAHHSPVDHEAFAVCGPSTFRAPAQPVAPVRERFYVITLQLPNAPALSTQHGRYFGDEDEYSAFLKVWEQACVSATAGTTCTWTTSNTIVLFYSLKDAE